MTWPFEVEALQAYDRTDVLIIYRRDSLMDDGVHLEHLATHARYDLHRTNHNCGNANLPNRCASLTVLPIDRHIRSIDDG